MSEICSIPVDLMIQILSQIPVRDIIRNLQFVCRKFYEIVHQSDLWCRIFEQKIRSEQFWVLLGSKKAIDFYRVNVCESYTMINVVSYMKCHSCNRYFLEPNQIYYCRCCSQTCYQCQDKIKSYKCKCMSCAKEQDILCEQCGDVIPYSGEKIKTECCQKTVCSKCLGTTEYKSYTHNDGHKTVRCRQHCYICEICGQLSMIQYIVNCCHRTVCQMCLTICGGCRQYHCLDHCHDNKCVAVGCCFSNRTAMCVYNGTICSQCQKPISYADMKCHPNIQYKQKYCDTCFHNKTWICQFCDQIVPLNNLKICDICLTIQCETHMSKTRNNTKNVCCHCIMKLYEMCDFCQQMYSVSIIKYVQNLKVCAKCLLEEDL